MHLMESVLTAIRGRRSQGDDAPSKPPALLKLRSSTSLILATVCIAVFTDIFLYSIIVPVIPFSLVNRAGVHPDDVQRWVSVLLATYAAALVGASPICGWLADRSSSRRGPLLLGLLALGGGTAMLCVGTSIGLLLGGRILQGVSAAVVWSVGLALVVDTVPEPVIGEALGYVVLALALATLLGPLLGGILYETRGYFPVFALAFAFIGIDIFLRLFLVEKKVAATWEEVEGADVAVETPGSSSGSQVDVKVGPQTTEEQQHKALEANDRLAPAAAEPVSTAGTSRRAWLGRRLPPVVTLLKSRRLLAALWATLVLSAIMTSFDSVLPLFVERVFGWNSLGAGLIFLPVVVPTCTAPLVGKACDRYGPRWLTTLGLLETVPFLILLRFVTHNSTNQKVLLCALLALVGLGIEVAMAPVMAEVTYIVSKKQRDRPGQFGPAGAFAQAYALFNCSWATGSLLGPLYAGFIQQRAGWATMAWCLALLPAVSAIVAFLWTGGHITKLKKAADGPGVLESGLMQPGGVA